MSRPFKNLKKQHFKNNTSSKTRLSKLKNNETKTFQTQNVMPQQFFIVSASKRNNTFYKKGAQLNKFNNYTNNSLNKFSIQHSPKSSNQTKMDSSLLLDNGVWSVQNVSCIEDEVKKLSCINDIAIVNDSSSKLEEMQNFQSNFGSSSVQLPMNQSETEISGSKKSNSSAKKTKITKFVFRNDSNENSHIKNHNPNNENLTTLSYCGIENRLQLKRTQREIKTSRKTNNDDIGIGISKRLKNDHCLSSGSFEGEKINRSTRHSTQEGTEIVGSSKSSNTKKGNKKKDESLIIPSQETNTFLSSYKSSFNELTIPNNALKGEMSVNTEVPPKKTVGSIENNSLNENDFSSFEHETNVYPLNKDEMLECSDEVDTSGGNLKNSCTIQDDCYQGTLDDYNNKTSTIDNEKETFLNLDKQSGFGTNSESKISDNSSINTYSTDIIRAGSCNSQPKKNKQNRLFTESFDVKNKSPTQISYISSIIVGASNSVYKHPTTSGTKKILKTEKKVPGRSPILTKINCSKTSKDTPLQMKDNSKKQEVTVMNNAWAQVDSSKDSSIVNSALLENADSFKNNEKSPNNCKKHFIIQEYSSIVNSELLDAKVEGSKNTDESHLKKDKNNKSKQKCLIINPNQIGIDFDASENMCLPSLKKNNNQTTQSASAECSDLAEIHSVCSKNTGLSSLKKIENHENDCMVNTNLSVIRTDSSKITALSLKEKKKHPSQNNEQDSVVYTNITEIGQNSSKNNTELPPLKKKKNHADQNRDFDHYADLTELNKGELSSLRKMNKNQTYQGNDTIFNSNLTENGSNNTEVTHLETEENHGDDTIVHSNIIINGSNNTEVTHLETEGNHRDDNIVHSNLTDNGSNNTEETHLETEGNHRDDNDYCLDISELSKCDFAYSINKISQDSDETDLENSEKIRMNSSKNNNKILFDKDITKQSTVNGRHYILESSNSVNESINQDTYLKSNGIHEMDKTSLQSKINTNEQSEMEMPIEKQMERGCSESSKVCLSRNTNLCKNQQNISTNIKTPIKKQNTNVDSGGEFSNFKCSSAQSNKYSEVQSKTNELMDVNSSVGNQCIYVSKKTCDENFAPVDATFDFLIEQNVNHERSKKCLHLKQKSLSKQNDINKSRNEQSLREQSPDVTINDKMINISPKGSNPVQDICLEEDSSRESTSIFLENYITENIKEGACKNKISKKSNKNTTSNEILNSSTSKIKDKYLLVNSSSSNDMNLNGLVQVNKKGNVCRKLFSMRKLKKIRSKSKLSSLLGTEDSCEGSVDNMSLSDYTNRSKVKSSTFESTNKLPNEINQSHHLYQHENINCKTTDRNEEHITTKTKKKISKQKTTISKINRKSYDSSCVSGCSGEFINKHTFSGSPNQCNQRKTTEECQQNTSSSMLGFGNNNCSIQKSNKIKSLIFTSTPIINPSLFISKPIESKKLKKLEEIENESGLLTCQNNNTTTKDNHERSTSIIHEGANYQSHVNAVIEEIKNYIMSLNDELKKLDVLEIDIDWMLPELHKIDNGCPETSKLHNSSDIMIVTSQFTEEEEETIKNNWEHFSNKYGFHDTDLFVSLVTLHEHLRRREILKFQQFLARDLPNRRLFSVYLKFKDIFSTDPRCCWSQVEDEILLNMHCFTKDQEIDGLVRNLLLPKILGRTAKVIRKRKNALLQDKILRELTERPVNWTPDLEGQLIYQLLNESNVDTVEDLRALTIPIGVWIKVVKELSLPFSQVIDHWRYNLYPRLFAINPVICPIFYMQLIKWIHDADVQKWEEVDWEELSIVSGGVGAYFLCKTLRLLILNFVPPLRHKYFRACIRYLYLYCWPNLVEDKNQYVLRRVCYNPTTRILEDIEDVEEMSSNEVSEDDLAS